jgi:hypothetical protein
LPAATQTEKGGVGSSIPSLPQLQHLRKSIKVQLALETAGYLPEFGDMQLSEISIEAVLTFLNQKAIEGKAVQTLKN